jgi:Carboxypeptidase regulatory-like domain
MGRTVSAATNTAAGQVGKRRLVLAASPVLAAMAVGCATIYSRGIVEVGAGDPVPGAEVRLATSTGQAVAAARTDANGCFFLQKTAPKNERRFILEIGAEGYKSAHLEVGLQPPILLVTLVPPSTEGESRVRATTAAERSEKWEPRCIPLFAGGGAQQLAPH